MSMLRKCRRCEAWQWTQEAPFLCDSCLTADSRPVIVESRVREYRDGEIVRIDNPEKS